MPQTLIIGGGPAGLAAAIALAERGARVRLFEADRALGGRARTEAADGYRLDLGPHALYPQAERLLGRLGVEVTGGRPREGVCFRRGDALHPIPSSAGALLTSPAFGLADKLRLARLFAGVERGAPAQRSVGEWLDGLGLRGEARAFVEAVVRLSTYAHAPARLSAAVAARQLAAGPVRYVDGGWSRLVDGLAARARALGVSIHLRARVDAVTEGEASVGGEAVRADAVALAVGPKRAVALLGARAPERLTRFAREAIAVRASHLAVALRALPRPAPALILGSDRPTYLSVQSRFARLAPATGAVIHLARYLAPGETIDPGEVRRALEARLDAAQPGWRAQVVTTRFAPASMVMHALPEARTGGLAGRPSPHLAPGLAIAGDWVGDTGLLLEAALASALAAAEALSGARATSARAAASA